MAADTPISGLPLAGAITGAERVPLYQSGVTVQTQLSAVLARGVLQSVAYASVINWDTSLGNMAAVTLTGNATLAIPTNLAPGSYILFVFQDATGGRTLGYSTGYKWPGGFAPVLSTAPNALDILAFVSDGVTMYGNAQKAFA